MFDRILNTLLTVIVFSLKLLGNLRAEHQRLGSFLTYIFHVRNILAPGLVKEINGYSLLIVGVFFRIAQIVKLEI